MLSTALLAGCASAPASSQTASSASSSQSSQSVSDQPAAALSQEEGYRTFAWNLYRQSSQDGQDGLISPLSAFYALGMCLNGAAGTTRTQMEEMLSMSTEQVNEQASALLRQIEEDPDSQLSLADSIWINGSTGRTIRQDYRDQMQSLYGADLFDQPFDEQTVDAVNSWVSRHTDGQIEKMVESLEPSAVLMLINALNFDAQWQTPYLDEQIVQGSFYPAEGSAETVNFMNSDEDLYVESQGLRGFIKPYENGTYGLAALIPQDEDARLEDVLKDVDSKALFEAIASPESTTVHASLPEFEVSQELPLNAVLQAMGMKDAFESRADFSALADPSDGLYVSDVLQKTKIKVDPKGTKAAAATEVTISETALVEDDSQNVVCDRPFVYMLIDMKTGTPLMIGTLQNPGSVQES